MKLKLVVMLAAALGASQIVHAQGSQEFSTFQKAAAYQSVLYRGHSATLYIGTLYNGHYFWETPDFRTGSVLFNGKRYTDVLLNIDACAQDLLVRSSVGAPSVVVSRNLVPEFQIEGQSFVNLELAGMKGAIPGFYRIAKEEPLIYQRIDKHLSSSTGNMNGPSIGYDDPNYREDVFNYFAREERFYIVKDNALKKIGRRKARKIIAQ